MGMPGSNYQVIYRGEVLPRMVPGSRVFFQRLKEYGGGSGSVERMKIVLFLSLKTRITGAWFRIFARCSASGEKRPCIR